jgi:hypothetical protein
MASVMLRTAIAVLAIMALPVLKAPAVDPPPEQLKVWPRPQADANSRHEPPTPSGTGAANAAADGRAVILSPQEYKKLLDTIEQLKQELQPPKPGIPSICRVSGRVETRGQADLARLRVVFEFRTTAPNTKVALGCRKAGAVGAGLDGGRLPVLQAGEDGYSVFVEMPGSHKLTLDLEVPLATRGAKGGERGFMLYLPGAPITLVESIELPTGVSNARLGGAPATGVAGTPIALPAKDEAGVALGPVTALEVSWDGPAPQKSSEPLLIANSLISVRLDDANVNVAARLTLQSRSGRVAEWKVQAPSGSEVNLEGTSGDLSLLPTDDKSTWRIRFQEPGVESVRLEFRTRLPRQVGPVPVGPYRLLGAFREDGELRVLAPNHLRPRFSNLRPDVSRTDADTEGQIVFAFGRTEHAPEAKKPLFFLDAEPVRGVVQTQTTHQLALEDSGWRLTSEIRATPIRVEMQTLDLEIPSQMQDVQAMPPELVESIVPHPELGPNRWQIRLAQARRSAVTLKLEGFYPAPPLLRGRRDSTPRELGVMLPRPLQTFDRDGRLVVVVPNGVELHGSIRDWDKDRIAEFGRPLEAQDGAGSFAAHCERTPARVDLTWGPLRAEYRVDSVIDLVLEENTVQARHRISLPPSASPRRLVLRPIPGLPPNQVRVLEGGTLTAQGGDWVLALPPSPGRDQSALLSYTSPLATKESLPNGRKVEPGLVWPASVTQCETRLRLWTSPATVNQQPSLADGPWEELAVEPVPDRASLPALVLHGSGVVLPLTLQLADATGLAPSGVAVERALILVDVFDGGRQAYEVKLWVRRLSGTWLDIEMPASPAFLELLQIRLGDKRIDQIQVVDDAGRPTSALQARTVRLPLQAIPEGQAREVTISYRRAANSGTWPWQSAFVAPRLRGSANLGVVRWQIQLPGEAVVLSFDSATVLEQRWGWRRLLPALRPARTRSDLLLWLRGGQASDEADASDSDATMADAAVLIRASELGAVRVTRIPRWTWLMLCSLLVLGLGLVLFAVRRVRWLFLGAALLLPLVAGTVAVVWPQPFAIFLAATPPGLLVLAAVLTTAWFLHRRYQRRVVFMPGFSRAKLAALPGQVSGSSLRRRQPAVADLPTGAPADAAAGATGSVH